MLLPSVSLAAAMKHRFGQIRLTVQKVGHDVKNPEIILEPVMMTGPAGRVKAETVFGCERDCCVDVIRHLGYVK